MRFMFVYGLLRSARVGKPSISALARLRLSSPRSIAPASACRVMVPARLKVDGIRISSFRGSLIRSTIGCCDGEPSMKIMPFLCVLLFVAFVSSPANAKGRQMPELIDMRTDGTAIFSCAGILLAAAHIKGMNVSDQRRVFDAYQRNDKTKQTLYTAMGEGPEAKNISAIWETLQNLQKRSRAKALSFLQNGNRAKVTSAASMCMLN